MSDFHFFDPEQESTVVYKQLPHWAQAGALAFITWRTADSLPAAALKRIVDERTELLKSLGIEPDSDWRTALRQLPRPDCGRAKQSLFESWDRQLDFGAGDCLLANPKLSLIVANSLRHFDDERYALTDFVVMPNHVHVLAALRDAEALFEQCTSWKRFTARRINSAVGRNGEFWQVEQFDQLVRSEAHFEHLRRYIADNPKKAGVAAGAYRHFSKTLT